VGHDSGVDDCSAAGSNNPADRPDRRNSFGHQARPINRGPIKNSLFAAGSRLYRSATPVTNTGKVRRTIPADSGEDDRD
jgi:hypothetical protein